MARKTGLTAETLKRIPLDAGAVYLNYLSTDPLKPKRLLGATRGGSTFTLTSETRDMPFDGITGIARGARRFLGVTVELTVNLIEVSKELIQMALPGSTFEKLATATTDDGVAITTENQYLVQRLLTATIPEIEYYDVAIVAEMSNMKTPVICGIKNALNNGNLELSFTDADESVLALTFTGTIDPLNPDEEPWFIITPEVAS
jgi:hypothetical protein